MGTQSAHGALGLFRNHSEWKIIPNDELFRSLSVMVQNNIKTDRLEHLGCPRPKSSKTSTKTYNLKDLGPIVRNYTKTSNLEPLNDTLRGFATLQAFKRHLPKALGLPGVSKRHPPRGLGLLRGWAPPGPPKRHPPRGLCQDFKGVQIRAKMY